MSQVIQSLIEDYLDKSEADTPNEESSREAILGLFSKHLTQAEAIVKRRIGMTNFKIMREAFFELGGEDDYSNIEEFVPKIRAKFESQFGAGTLNNFELALHVLRKCSKLNQQLRVPFARETKNSQEVFITEH